MSPKDKAMTRMGLRTLAHMVKFHCKKLTGFVGLAHCEEASVRSRWGCSPFWTGDFHGSTTEIRYEKCLYEQLCALDAYDEDETKARLHFAFASLLVHEVAHAATAAEYGSADEWPFEHSTMAEAGFDWEAHVFGGIIRTSDNDSTQTLEMWPSGSTRNYYVFQGMDFAAYGECPAVDLHWFIPCDYALRLFTTAFWEENVAAEGAAALKIPQTLGYRCLVLDSGNTACFAPDATSAEFFDGLPDGCFADDRGYVGKVHESIGREEFGRLMRINQVALFPNALTSRMSKDDRGWEQ